jgi:hypothetical protein
MKQRRLHILDSAKHRRRASLLNDDTKIPAIEPLPRLPATRQQCFSICEVSTTCLSLLAVWRRRTRFISRTHEALWLQSEPDSRTYRPRAIDSCPPQRGRSRCRSSSRRSDTASIYRECAMHRSRQFHATSRRHDAAMSFPCQAFRYWLPRRELDYSHQHA